MTNALETRNSFGIRPEKSSAALLLEDGSLFWGKALGFSATSNRLKPAELCFNTSMSGYQEALTDPSYAGQIITFTFPHIGNTGTTPEDRESILPAVCGAVLNAEISLPSNWRAVQGLNDWLVSNAIPAICGIDTRAITRLLRDKGSQKAVIIHQEENGSIDVITAQEVLDNFSGLEGMDLAATVTCLQPYEWRQTAWTLDAGFSVLQNPVHKVVAIDYGAKQNILRCLASAGCAVLVVPANTSARDILDLEPDGVFLSNGPGDPAATGRYAVPIIQDLLTANIPIFGICLGHQLLALAMGAKTAKMHMGHRGANHPVKDLATGLVEITSQNHGFAVDPNSFGADVEPSHISLFDGTNEGLRVKSKPAFSVQYHPEASPGPQDSHYLFTRFTDMIAKHKARTA